MILKVVEKKAWNEESSLCDSITQTGFLSNCPWLTLDTLYSAEDNEDIDSMQGRLQLERQILDQKSVRHEG